jgi:hypothetical protein
MPLPRPIQLDQTRGTVYTFVTISHDGQTLAYGLRDSEGRNAVILCSIRTGKETKRLPHQGGYALQDGLFSPDDERILLRWERAVSIWNPNKGDGELVVRGAGGAVWTPDGARLVGWKKPPDGHWGDGRLHIWDAATGEELAHFAFEGPYGRRGPVAFSADGQVIAVEHPQIQRLYVESEKMTGKSPRPCRYRLAVDLWELSTERRLGPVGKEAPPVVVTYGPEPATQLPKVGAEPGGFRVRTLPGGRFLLLPDYDHPPSPPLTVTAEHPAPPRDEEQVGRWALVLAEAATGRELRRFPDFVDGHLRLRAISPDGRSLVATGHPSRKDLKEVLLIWDLSDLIRTLPRPADLTDAELAALIRDLDVDDARKAFPAMRSLAAVPDRAPAVLAEHVRPVDAGPIPQLIAQLDADDPEVRDKASHELGKLGMKVWPALHKALADKPSAEVRRRIKELLKDLDGDLPTEELRGIRAVDVVERIGTDKARAVLKTLAGGAPGALTTQAARDALGRLAKR